MTDILTLLNKENPWWESKTVPKSLKMDKQRDEIHLLKTGLDEERIMIITGLRRVGKTVLMYQLIDYLISNNIPAKNILYVSLDNIYLNSITKEPIKDSIDTFFVPKVNMVKFDPNWS